MRNITNRIARRGFRFTFASKALTLSALALAASMMLSSTPVHAYGSRHAFCIQGDEYPGLSTCTFDTYAQCLASASGRNLYCIANPYFGGETDDPYAYQNRGRRLPPGYVPSPPNPYWYR